MNFKKLCLSATAINIALMSVGASVVPAFAAQSELPSNLYGNWTLSYDWACSGKPSSTPLVINNNGTFSLPSQSYTGKWSFAGDSIVLKFSSIDTTYTGVAYSGTMKGRSTNFSGSYGCWTANKISTTTSTHATPQYLDSAGVHR